MSEKSHEYHISDFGRSLKLITAMGLFFLYIGSALAQQAHIRLYVNGGIDTANVGISQVIQLWEDYLNSNPDSTIDSSYWLSSEQERYNKPDLMNTAYFSPSLYYFLPHWKATVMSVLQIDGGFVIRTLLATQTDSGFSRPFCIVQVAAIKEAGRFKLCNILPINTQSWQREKVGSITFIFPQSHHFNRELAQHMNAFVDSLTKIWSIKPFATEFYLADDLSDIMKMRGFDFFIGEGYNRGPGGMADIANRIVFGAGQDEWYPHEFVHIYINPLFPNAHYYFLEGYAALLGGSKGHELLWHMKRMHRYLEQHQEQDLNDLLAFRHFDNLTDPKYVFGGLLCEMALRRGGLSMLKQLMSVGEEDKDFYRALKTILGIHQDKLNEVIRTYLVDYVTRNR